MITGVAFCPQAPALVPDVGQGLDAELGPLREACRTAIRRVAPSGTQIVVVGSGAHNATFGPTSRGSFAGFGVDLVVPLGSDEDGPTDLPPSLAVGAWLVRDALGADTGATGLSVAPVDSDSPNLHGPDPTALVVVGDGSAQRSEKAPGYLNPAGAEFDRMVSSALRDGNGFLLHVAEQGPDVMSSGAAVWEEVAWSAEEWHGDSELLYDDAPFGVGYFVAAWTSTTPHEELWRRHREILEANERWANDPKLRARTRVRLVG